MLIEDLKHLIARLEGDIELDLGHAGGERAYTEVDDLLNNIAMGHRGFLASKMGTSYYDAWLQQLKSEGQSN